MYIAHACARDVHIGHSCVPGMHTCVTHAYATLMPVSGTYTRHTYRFTVCLEQHTCHFYLCMSLICACVYLGCTYAWPSRSSPRVTQTRWDKACSRVRALAARCARTRAEPTAAHTPTGARSPLPFLVHRRPPTSGTQSHTHPASHPRHRAGHPRSRGSPGLMLPLGSLRSSLAALPQPRSRCRRLPPNPTLTSR